jgi:hypothetical protein
MALTVHSPIGRSIVDGQVTTVHSNLILLLPQRCAVHRPSTIHHPPSTTYPHLRFSHKRRLIGVGDLVRMGGIVACEGERENMRRRYELDCEGRGGQAGLQQLSAAAFSHIPPSPRIYKQINAAPESQDLAVQAGTWTAVFT